MVPGAYEPPEGEGAFNYVVTALSNCSVTIYGKHFYGMGGPTYDTADNPNMDMECLITLDDAVTALYAQLNAPSRRS